ncbi:LLM class flavin-dependent oxidoreductase [Streptomyces cylindrosporus]|uniref:LLM class flavin-dependent oxidoreductase n=1 Tax=Streptomyces cylindrosporus TaxID=2927583 RepID=A0ABS9YI76_9ACTN|nr:LLM class flavin-dependent oxidoreductase [Streptomyces cylindrosporus]
MTVRPRRRMHLAAYFPGVDNTTVRADPRSRSRIEFSSFEHLARTAERGLFDFFFLAESLTVLSALAGVTERLGLAATVDATFNEPYELARRLATLDHLSGGRAAWNVVTSSDASTGANFRRGVFLNRADRYVRAAEFVAVARKLWDSWTPEGVSRPVAHRGRHFDIAGEFTVPRPPQGHPVVIQAGDSDEGREFAAATADVVFTRQSSLESGRAFYADVKRRLAKYGRTPDDLKIMSGVSVVLGDTAADAREKAAEIRRQQNSLYDPDGPRSFVGTPEAVAGELDDLVRREACDGFVLVPHLTPTGLDGFVDRVVPLLQERGAFRTEYRGATLRSHLGLSEPVWKG